jgi:hypothetical protein
MSERASEMRSESAGAPCQLRLDGTSVPVEGDTAQQVRQAASEFVAAQDAASAFVVGLEYVVEDKRDTQLVELAARFERVWASYHDLVTAMGYPIQVVHNG